MRYKAIFFDLIGTTLLEKSPDVVLNSFQQAFESKGIIASSSELKLLRGRDKQSMIRDVLQKHGQSVEAVDSVYNTFKSNLIASADQFVVHAALPKLFHSLKQRDCFIGVGTGLSRELFNIISSATDYPLEWVDYTGTSDDVSESRPSPEMILDFMKCCSVGDPGSVLKVGDTTADIEEGKNAGVMTAVILSGTQEEFHLRSFNPDFVCNDLSSIERIVNHESM